MKKIALIIVILTAVALVGVKQIPSTATHAAVNPYPATVNFNYNSSKTSFEAKLSNLENVSLISYTLTYNYKGVKQGVSGSFSPNGKTSIEKSLFLGTCSGKDCILHGYITNLTLKVTFTYKDGYTVTQTFTL